MSTLKKDHILGAGGGALVAGAAGATLGAVVAGAPGMAAGAAAGAALGAVVGNRMAETADRREDLGHFQQIFHTMPYYVSGMTWADYAPAYGYGLDTYRTRGGQPFTEAEAALGEDWDRARGVSQLAWNQARHAVAHAWRELDDTLHARGR